MAYLERGMPYFVFVDTNAVLVRKTNVVISTLFRQVIKKNIQKVFTILENSDTINMPNKSNI